MSIELYNIIILTAYGGFTNRNSGKSAPLTLLAWYVVYTVFKEMPILLNYTKDLKKIFVLYLSDFAVQFPVDFKSCIFYLDQKTSYRETFNHS
jgi:hypothetical protein